jgi:glutamyl-Q tRNA(Asp) synthetase
MEDLDREREVAGCAVQQLRTLEAFGLHWDGPVEYQSARSAHYRAALEELQRQGVTFACSCSRRELADEGGYPGTCRAGPQRPGPAATRFRVPAGNVSFEDRLQGPLEFALAERGDVVIRRRDGAFAYQLAVVVDDALQGITDVVRGADLLDSTARQIHLQRLLGLPTPHYLHLPVATNAAGEKLSKQTLAPPVDARNPVPALAQVMQFLGQAPPAHLRHAPLAEFWAWARAHWDASRIAHRCYLPAP